MSGGSDGAEQSVRTTKQGHGVLRFSLRDSLPWMGGGFRVYRFSVINGVLGFTESISLSRVRVYRLGFKSFWAAAFGLGRICPVRA